LPLIAENISSAGTLAATPSRAAGIDEASRNTRGTRRQRNHSTHGNVSNGSNGRYHSGPRLCAKLSATRPKA